MKNCLTVEETKQLLKSCHQQVTKQRVALCQYVLCEAYHPTVETIKEWALKQSIKISLATIYNTLNMLVQEGFLKVYRFPNSDSMVYDNNTDSHYHIIDHETGEIHDLALNQLKIEHNLDNWQVFNTEIVLHARKNPKECSNLEKDC